MPLSFPTATIVGEIYQDGIKKWIWNGGAWDRVDPEEAPISDTAPNVAVIGNTWFNTDTGKMYYYDESEMWIQVSGTPLTADQRPDFSSDGHSATVTESIISGGTNVGGGATKSGVGKLSFSTTADITSFGVLGASVKYHASASSGTSHFAIGGNNGTSNIPNIQKVDHSTNTTSASHGSVSLLAHNNTASSDAHQFMNIAGINQGVRRDTIHKMAFAAGSSSLAHGNLTMKRSVAASASDGYQVMLIAGHGGTENGGKVTRMERMNFGYNVTATHYGDLSASIAHHFGTSDGTNMMVGNGTDINDATLNTIMLISFDAGTIGNTRTDIAATGRNACSNGTDAMVAGGLNSSSSNFEDFVVRYSFAAGLGTTASFGASVSRQGHGMTSGGA
jgi:hypothetical protein